MHGIPPQEPGFACAPAQWGGMPPQLGNFAYNLDTHAWRRLKFTKLRANHYEECLSSHLAFPLPSSELQLEMLHTSREALMTAVLCFRNVANRRVNSHCQDIWRHVFGFLVAPGRGRLIIVRQSDAIHKFEEPGCPLDNIVVVFDLLTLEWHPVSTNSMVNNERDDGAGQRGSGLWQRAFPGNKGARLHVMDGHDWVNAAIFHDPQQEAFRLLAHGSFRETGAPCLFASTVH